jgi:hypothetical protein
MNEPRDATQAEREAMRRVAEAERALSEARTDLAYVTAREQRRERARERFQLVHSDRRYANGWRRP